MDSSYAIRSFCSLFYLIFGFFPGPARPIRSFLAGTCQHHLFFHGDIWKLWALLNVKVTASVLALLFLYFSWPPGPKSMQGPCTYSLLLSGFLVSLPPFIHSIIQQKGRVPPFFKAKFMGLVVQNHLQQIDRQKSTYTTYIILYPIESMYGIFAHIWLILMVNNWYIYQSHGSLGVKIIIPCEPLRYFVLSPEVDHREVRKVDENTDINVPRRQLGRSKMGWLGRNSRRSQHIDNIEYPPGNDRIFHLWKRKILFPATFQGDVLLPSKVTIYSVRLVIKPDNWFFNTV